VDKIAIKIIFGGYMFNRRALIAAIALSVIIVAQPTYAQDKSIVVASTTSTQDSGLFEYRGNSGTTRTSR
jgi:ABC-type tungstate transport system permease subunit